MSEQSFPSLQSLPSSVLSAALFGLIVKVYSTSAGGSHFFTICYKINVIFGVGPELVDAMLTGYRLRHNPDVDTMNRLVKKYKRHYDSWLLQHKYRYSSVANVNNYGIPSDLSLSSMPSNFSSLLIASQQQQQQQHIFPRYIQNTDTHILDSYPLLTKKSNNAHLSIARTRSYKGCRNKICSAYNQSVLNVGVENLREYGTRLNARTFLQNNTPLLRYALFSSKDLQSTKHITKSGNDFFVCSQACHPSLNA
ncbi:hypothetical protein EDC94DRAFT_581060 [Helicostylum pulchrum]|nr:hypothetical protein EDC94DRAFT_581060 [Helicostylum pulchrum]